MFNRIKKVVGYLLDKKSEIVDLEVKDALLAKLVIDIHRMRVSTSYIQLPLFCLKQIHAIDRENAIEATQSRVEILRAQAKDILEKKIVTKEMLGECLPSVSGIKVVKESESSYIAFEGNGRLVALQEVFQETDGIEVVVEEYRFKSPGKILRRIRRVRRYNNLV